MIVLKYLQAIKQAVNEETATFMQLLERAQTKEFPNKEVILTHFRTIHIKEQGNYVHFMYNNQHMFKNPWDDFYMQTRALVIDWKQDNIVLYPFDKFFELDEHKRSTKKEVQCRLLKASLIEVTEKIDGSLIVARYVNDDFLVVSSGSLQGPHVEIAKRILAQDENLQRMIKAYPQFTFILEMKNAEIPQLIKYEEDQLTIIGLRDMETYRLLSRDEIRILAEPFGTVVAPLYYLTVDEMLAIMEDPATTNNEGYILRMDDFLVKMKTKNFILANRFAGDPARNFNMVMQCIQEGRVEAVRPMIKQEYKEAFDRFTAFIKQYTQEKEANLRAMLDTLPQDGDMREFVRTAQSTYFPYVKQLIALKNGQYQPLSKEDVKKIKPLAAYFTCVAHYKYAEHEGIPLEEIEQRIETGDIAYIKRFEDTTNNRYIYILPKWQWLTDEMLPQGVN